MFMTKKTGAAAFACRRGADAAVRRVAGRGRHRIFKGHPAVYGVCRHWIRKKLNPLARFRGFIQAGATLLTNLHLPNFAKGTLYQGSGKYVCVPGLNCYSCPGAAGACPVGAFQAVIGSSKFRFSYYITGILILFGVLLGRFICGFLCPFGWFQELLHKIPSPSFPPRS